MSPLSKNTKDNSCSSTQNLSWIRHKLNAGGNQIAKKMKTWYLVDGFFDQPVICSLRNGDTLRKQKILLINVIIVAHELPALQRGILSTLASIHSNKIDQKQPVFSAPYSLPCISSHIIRQDVTMYAQARRHAPTQYIHTNTHPCMKCIK